jgi:hypothetical protein
MTIARAWSARCAEMNAKVLLEISIAEMRDESGDPDGGILCLEELAGALPDNVPLRIVLAAMLNRRGRHAEADAAIDSALAHNPFDPELLIAYATNSMLREAWSEAYCRWQIAAYRFPRLQRIRAGIATAQLFLNEAGMGAAPLPLGARETAAIGTLMARFVSLGSPPSYFGCEFGMLQRQFGAEPIDLFRWANIPVDKLAEALEREFEGIGNPEQTELFLPNPAADYRTKDTHYEIDTHTFVKSREMPKDAVLAQACRRLSFLKRKLIADLEGAERVFVYTDDNGKLPMSDIVRVHDAMRRYGDAKFLLVRRCVEGGANSPVRLFRRGLAVAALPPAHRATGQILAEEASSWVRVCWDALALLMPRATGASAGRASGPIDPKA